MSQFSFEYPQAFLLLALFLLCSYFCKERVQSIYFPHITNILAKRTKRSSFTLFLKWFGIISAIVAFASPVIKDSINIDNRDGRDIVLILDSSESMREFGFDTSNFAKDRFSIAKEAMVQFIQNRTNDRIGLVTFADSAFIASPLTFDGDLLTKLLSMQRVAIAGRRTAINDALVYSYEMLSKSKAKEKIAILLTDGIDNMSMIPHSEVLSMIKNSNITLYTIGIGRNGEYDAWRLKEMADAGKGVFFEANDAKTLQAIYALIDKKETTKLQDRSSIKITYLYHFPLFVAIFALLFFIYLKERIER
ncbi:MAG: VWA domain-containing protein [Campylobacterales bacterium]|nr:VWA domain-containing protein [Campylobacterales bacterium]